MTEDMPTVDGARAEAERRHGIVNSTHRGILGGYVRHCSCGASIVEPEGGHEATDAHLAGPPDRPRAPRTYRQGRIDGRADITPTVAALEAEVVRLRAEADEAQRHLAYHLADFRPGADEKATGDLAVDMAAYATRQRARADAAEAVIERVQGLSPLTAKYLDGGMFNAVRLDDLLTALSDAAPQTVGRRDQVLSVADVLPNGTYTLTVTDEGASIGTRPEPAERRVLAAVNAYLRTLDRKPGEVMTAAEVARQIRSRIASPDATDGREGA